MIFSRLGRTVVTESVISWSCLISGVRTRRSSTAHLSIGRVPLTGAKKIWDQMCSRRVWSSFLVFPLCTLRHWQSVCPLEKKRRKWAMFSLPGIIINCGSKCQNGQKGDSSNLLTPYLDNLTAFYPSSMDWQHSKRLNIAFCPNKVVVKRYYSWRGDCGSEVCLGGSNIVTLKPFPSSSLSMGLWWLLR